MNITGHNVEKLEDPFGLLAGDRYEFFLDLDVDEEDELYSEKGIGLKVIFVVNGDDVKLSTYYFYENGTEEVFDFALEDDEEELVLKYCQEHLPE